MALTTWNKNDLLKIYELHEEGRDFSEIGESLGRSARSVSARYGRTDWDSFIEDPEAYLEGVMGSKRWTNDEMIQLDAYLQAGKSYNFIAEKLNRGIISVERKAQTTSWKSWRKTLEEISSESHEEVDSDRLVSALLSFCRHDIERLNGTSEEQFLAKFNLDSEHLPIPFKDIKKQVEIRLIEMGFANPESITYGEGTYIVVGDSHGKETKGDMFDLLLRVNKVVKPDKIIHIGHILDDDDDISYDWGKFNNLVVVAKDEELQLVQEQRNKFNFNYNIVREMVFLGEKLEVFNQDMITDYTKQGIGGYDPEILENNSIFNCHRMEFFPQCIHGEPKYVMSPGALCEKHIVKTIRHIDLKDGVNKAVKAVFHDGAHKHRRRRSMIKYWNQGLLVVQVNKEGRHTTVPYPIEVTHKGHTMAYFDKMIASKGVYKPTKKMFISADMHSNLHDVDVLDMQEQVCNDYKPDVLVNLGDAHNYTSLNHHVMSRGEPIKQKILDEAAVTHYLLKRMSKWANECYILYGNHERFARDFTNKFPQFGEYLDFEFLCDIKALGYKTVKLKEVLKIGSTKFIHGEMTMYGASGSKLEKASRTFNTDVVFLGHIHYPSIRFGCYSVGLSGKLDQNYNEPNASRWINGFAMCNHFGGKSFPTTIAITNGSCLMNGKEYRPQNPASWRIAKYSAKLTYDIESK